jgi:hypothetical protein
MSKANFFSLPCELRNAVYGYLWQSTTDLIIQHGPVELHASSSHPNEHDQAISPFSLVCAERMYTTHSVSGSTRYGFPAWLFTNKQILSEGTAKLNWSCGRSMLYDYRHAQIFQQTLTPLLLPIKQHGKPLVVTLDAKPRRDRQCDTIHLNVALEHLENIGHFIKECLNAKNLQIDINLGDVPRVIQLFMCYKLEKYLEETSEWNLNMDRVTVTLRSRHRLQVQWDNAFRTRVLKSLEKAGRMICSTQDDSKLNHSRMSRTLRLFSVSAGRITSGYVFT